MLHALGRLLLQPLPVDLVEDERRVGPQRVRLGQTIQRDLDAHRGQQPVRVLHPVRAARVQLAAAGGEADHQAAVLEVDRDRPGADLDVTDILLDGVGVHEVVSEPLGDHQGVRCVAVELGVGGAVRVVPVRQRIETVDDLHHDIVVVGVARELPVEARDPAVGGIHGVPAVVLGEVAVVGYQETLDLAERRGSLALAASEGEHVRVPFYWVDGEYILT